MTSEWEKQYIVPIDENSDRPGLHKDARKDFLLLRQESRKHNLELAVASGYRNYDRQREIWNGKASGKIPLRNEKGDIIPTRQLSKEKLVLTILRWSALPGFSRHHWGSDLDVFDAEACKHPQLLPREYHPGGVCHPLFLFLQKNMTNFGFFYPYDRDRGGIYPEPWHISHRKTAQSRQKNLTLEGFRNFIALRQEEILLSKEILKQSYLIFEHFIDNISP